ncbi:MAG: DNA-3-methyladenine glycosylase 2 family protein [Planctomycetes bacterium]|nr:DNA-3-methyladenine glycosylase 2 family protein [Planctomycetota bacterium]
MPRNPFLKAQRHLGASDKVLKEVIARVGPCTLTYNPDGFGVLARAIVSQQISSKAALAISGRLQETLGASGICPAAILRAKDERLRAAGLSASKTLSLRDLAEHCRTGKINFDELPELDDEEVIARLIPVRGIGRWTAEMFLIFSLGRPDVLPLADYGLRAGVQKNYALPEIPVKQVLTDLAEPWRPYRSIATWFIWRSLGNVPQS